MWGDKKCNHKGKEVQWEKGGKECGDVGVTGSAAIKGRNCNGGVGEEGSASGERGREEHSGGKGKCGLVDERERAGGRRLKRLRLAREKRGRVTLGKEIGGKKHWLRLSWRWGIQSKCATIGVFPAFQLSFVKP
ncbi:hypothetical protein VNO78_22996 [Psophocarpus tetragonolobus]|uniref:Uncharacterized protein n=1 Tax=Psophocarpus tetragonolobus TaxID=3891 RepID=A0AAN9S2Z1_PSOTE